MRHSCRTSTGSESYLLDNMQVTQVKTVRDTLSIYPALAYIVNRMQYPGSGFVYFKQ